MITIFGYINHNKNIYIRHRVLPGRGIKRQHYQIPSAQEIFSRIWKAKYFSTLDATSGFLQVSLAEDSTSLNTIATPFGRYKFLRIPFGLSSSPEAYQQMMVDLFGDGVDPTIFLCGLKQLKDIIRDWKLCFSVVSKWTSSLTKTSASFFNRN